jgi:hypothetical protein
MDEHEHIIALLKDIQANQASLHDDMAAIVDTINNLQQTIASSVGERSKKSS